MYTIEAPVIPEDILTLFLKLAYSHPHKIYIIPEFTEFAEWAEVMSQMIEGGIELKISEDKIQEFSVNHMVEQMEKVFKK